MVSNKKIYKKCLHYHSPLLNPIPSSCCQGFDWIRILPCKDCALCHAMFLFCCARLPVYQQLPHSARHHKQFCFAFYTVDAASAEVGQFDGMLSTLLTCVLRSPQDVQINQRFDLIILVCFFKNSTHTIY